MSRLFYKFGQIYLLTFNINFFTAGKNVTGYVEMSILRFIPKYLASLMLSSRYFVALTSLLVFIPKDIVFK